MIPPPARSVVAVVAALVVAGCGVDLAQTPPPAVRPTAQQSLAVPIEGARAALAADLVARAGVALDDAPEGYRPPEPPILAAAARGVFKVRLLDDPDRLYVVVYQFVDRAAAADAGREAARYFSSGPGQVQFAADAQFALSQYGETLVFAAWSPANTTDVAPARAAFGVIQAFGQPITLVK